MINHIPPIGSKRVFVYMAEENMKPVNRAGTLLDQTMKAKYERSVMATVERSEFSAMRELRSSERNSREKIISYPA
tara:strand:- start:3788 stop:4015 length:228 start_codon:yes stop_codon:yes gene_type:complete